MTGSATPTIALPRGDGHGATGLVNSPYVLVGVPLALSLPQAGTLLDWAILTYETLR